MTINCAEHNADKNYFRWLNFGSCMMRIAFDTPEFFRQNYQGLPIAVSKIWRRQLPAIMNDWDVIPELSAGLPDSQFRDAWLSSRDVFESADVILVDIILDIFSSQCMRFAADDETPLASFSQVISNFPEEPPEHLLEKIGVFDTTDQDVLNAWERFGDEVLTPTVFITYEHNDEIKEGYAPELRERLLTLQASIEKLSERFPHWLVIDMDEVFASSGCAAECYIDRHHPSDTGWKILRAEVPRLIAECGILRDVTGGFPLPGGTRFVPERGDFGVVDADYVQRLRDLDASACAVGPERLTMTMRQVYGSELCTYPSFGALKANETVDLIIALKWDQPVRVLPWIAGLMKQHVGAIIELPCLWKGREYALLSPEEFAIRNSVRKLARDNSSATILLNKLAVAEALYVARCALNTHTFDRKAAALRPRQISPDAQAIELPDEIVSSLSAMELVPVFGPH